ERQLAVDVRAGGPLDYVEVVKNGRGWARRDGLGAPRDDGPRFRGRVVLALGWGEPGEPTLWRVALAVRGGRLLGVEPRLRGEEQPEARFGFDGAFHVGGVARRGDEVELTTRSWKNPTTRTDATQKLALEIEGDGGTRLALEVNGEKLEVRLADLRRGPRAGFLDGFVSPAWQLSRAVPEAESRWRCTWEDVEPGPGPDVYYVRVRQKNDQWAWSSPVFVGG
ncbi:MAG: hypothetical protein R3263_08900, partial [Myxococcota bacterium]|nr:hypothetical protein [Myxococcota bacterium]